MTLDQTIKSLEIKRILIVDDTKENIDAAKECFSKYKEVNFDYATSAKEAKEKIVSAYKNQKYDVVMTDMQMEQKDSGLEVVKESFKHQTIAAIITGQNYENLENNHHGPNTRMQIMDTTTSVIGKKEKPEVWEYLFEKVIDYLATKPMIINSLNRSYKFTNKPIDDNLVNLTVELYK